jgi:hypothetical protein
MMGGEGFLNTFVCTIRHVATRSYLKKRILVQNRGGVAFSPLRGISHPILSFRGSKPEEYIRISRI